jgi:hypothetical protein
MCIVQCVCMLCACPAAASPRDDLVALGYVLAHLSTGTLPWLGATGPADRLEKKRKATVDQLCPSDGAC